MRSVDFTSGRKPLPHARSSHSGGTFGFALGQIETAGFTLYGAADDWVVMRITRDGSITFEGAEPYRGKGNNEAAALLFERYGNKVSFALCGPVGEYLGLVAGIAFADTDGRPSRLAARGGGGVGAKPGKLLAPAPFDLSGDHLSVH